MAASAYRQAYDTLARIAAELEGGETDLDRVLPLLTEARAAYDLCKARIEAVRQALGDDWDEDGLGDDEEDDEDES